MAMPGLGMVIGAIVEMSVEGTLEKVRRREIVIKVLQKLGLDPANPPSDFEGVYVYTLVEYGAQKPRPILVFFRHQFIRNAFRKSFETRDPSILEREAESLIEWHQVGDDLRRMDVDPRAEFARFSAVFNTVVDRTRTPAEVKRDQKLDDIHHDLLNLEAQAVPRWEGMALLNAIRDEVADLDPVSCSQPAPVLSMPSDRELRVFISSTMTELCDVREVVSDVLRTRGIGAFVYEQSAGARPGTSVTTSLQEVEQADVYVGLFWKEYGEVTVREFRHARELGKPCFIYVRQKNLVRDPKLEAFLGAEVHDLIDGVTYDYFDSALRLGEAVARDIMSWFEREYRALGDRNRRLEDSRRRIQELTKEMRPTPPDPVLEKMIQ